MAIFTGYAGAKVCTGTIPAGARGLMAWFLAKYTEQGGVNSGIYNCRSIRGGVTASLHGEGRAVDLGIRPHGAGYGTQLAEQLRLHSAELGIQCIIWNRRIWSGYYKDWQAYTGTNPHVDHLHVELSWAAARRGTDEMIDLLEATLDDLKLTPAAPPKPVKENSGNSREENIAIARTLNALGYAAGVPDGFAGPYLRAGVKAYQAAQEYFPGRTVDGDWGPQTQAHFDWVRKELQPEVAKYAASEREGHLDADGDYGEVTREHVREVQEDNYPAYKRAGGYYKDGLAGPVTCKFLGIKAHPGEK